LYFCRGELFQKKIRDMLNFMSQTEEKPDYPNTEGLIKPN